MIDSYISRQNWLQKNQAVAVINTYADAMSGDKSTAANRGTSRSGNAAGKKVSGGALLGMMGQRVVRDA